MSGAEIRARYRKGAIFVTYLLRIGLASLLAWPLAEHLARAGGGMADDLALFEPGGLYLLEALRLAAPALQAEFRRTALVILLAAYLGLIPLAGLMWALSQEGRLRWRALLQSSLRPLGSFSLLLGLAIFAYGLLFGLTLLGTLALRAWHSPHALFAQLASLGLMLLAMAFVGIVHDLSRARVVLFGSNALPSLRAALRDFGMRPVFDWGIRFLASVVVFLAAARLVGALGSERVILVGVVHQLALLGFVAARASWLAAAMREVAGRGGAREGA